jgi:ATP-binding cassette subfamily G (WHITE) protein 2 (SNQ2)
MTSTQAAPGVDKAGPTAAMASSPLTGGPGPSAQEQERAQGQQQSQPTADAAHEHASFVRQTSHSWGEQGPGEPVDVDAALREFELARHRTRSSLGEISPTRTGRRRAPSQRRTPKGADLESLGEKAEKDGFDLSQWILTRQAQAKESGVDGDKPLGMSWRDVDVLSPPMGPGVFVKTLPKAITNTFWKDPWGVATIIFPPIQKLQFWGPKNVEPTKIIQNHNGVLLAGEMLLVLGRPNSGCTTTLRALTTNISPPLTRTGHLHYGGFSPDEVERKFRGEVIFVDEDDIHFPT